MISTIHSYLFMGISSLFLFQSIILFVRSKNNRARKTMAYLEMAWALIYIVVLISLTQINGARDFTLLREYVLVIGSFCITFTNFFPIQVLLPGWLNWKNMFLLTLPNIIAALVYYGGMYLLGESPESLHTYGMLWDSIGHFNVWFRFVILITNIIYLLLILKWLYGYEKKYIQWKNENFSDQEYVDISWMRSYDYIVIGISIFYLGMLFIGGRIPIFCHSIFVCCSFSYLFYKILFHESPYPTDFFAPQPVTNGDEEMIKSTPYEYDFPIASEAVSLNDQAFENKIQSYTTKLKQWMDEEKPYLFNDFKLTDVSRILPLNRTYLSRVFNDGFGKNFSEVIRIYRVNYSKEILKKNPDLPMYKVAELSGFRSDSTYVKAFRQIMNMSPTQYKLQYEKDDE